MRILYTLLTVSMVGTILVVSGCGATQSQNSTRTNEVTTNTPEKTTTPSKQTVWIEYARYTAYQAHDAPTYWVVTDKHVNHVGQFLGAVDDSSTQSGWHSNSLSVGTKFYTIQGIPFAKEFAVQMQDGTYVEAVSVGSKKPS